MKNNRDNELKESSPEDIPVFLVLALIILSVQFISIHLSFSDEDIPSGAHNIAEVYLWAAGSADHDEGLYLFSRQQMAETFPELLPLIPEASTRPVSNPTVAAVRYSSDLAERVDLPPEVANIFFRPIPINRADKNILRSLPGIGQVLAERIVQRREEYGPFKSKDELLHISGIGPKKFARLVDHVTID